MLMFVVTIKFRNLLGHIISMMKTIISLILLSLLWVYLVAQATGTANLIPIAYGTVSSSEGILSGSGNFSVSYDSTNKNYEITIDGHSFSYSQYTVSVMLSGLIVY